MSALSGCVCEVDRVRIPLFGVLAVGLDFRDFFPEFPGAAFGADASENVRFNVRRAEQGWLLLATGDLLSMHRTDDGGFVVGKGNWDLRQGAPPDTRIELPGTPVPEAEVAQLGSNHWWCFADGSSDRIPTKHNGFSVAHIPVQPGIYEFVLPCQAPDWCADEHAPAVYISIHRVGELTG